MHLPNTQDQAGYTQLLAPAVTTITAGGTSQRCLGRAISRSFLFIQNLSAGPLYIEIGDARASATLSGAGIASFTVLNGGFGYTKPPRVSLWGGWNQNNTAMVASGQYGYPVPPHLAVAHAVLTGGVVTSIVVDDPGLLYAVAPDVELRGDPMDPHGVADPYFSSTNSGFLLQPNGGNVEWNGTLCPTGPVSIWGATTAQAFTLRWIP